jgi:hypothetical protein
VGGALTTDKRWKAMSRRDPESCAAALPPCWGIPAGQEPTRELLLVKMLFAEVLRLGA